MALKKKVAFFTENLYGGGVEKILQTVLRYINYDKYDVTLWSNRGEHLDPSLYPGPLRYRWIFAGNTQKESYFRNVLAKIGNKLKLFVYYHASPSLFYRLFVRSTYDCGVAFIEGYATRILSGAPKIMRKVTWVHIELSTYHWSQVAYRNKREERLAYSLMDKIVCVSQIVKSQVIKLFDQKAKTIVIYNPIDRNLILQQAYVASDFPKVGNSLTIIGVGSLTKRKGFERLINIVSALILDGLNCCLWILGEGSERGSLEKQINDLSLGSRVLLLGYKNNPYPYISKADIYVCSSFAEGYNTAITESLILGKPIVSTDCSGVREQLGDSEYGLVVNNDYHSLLIGLRMMTNDCQLREYYSEKAFERGRLFSVEGVIDQIEALL